jgi:hypothetical protein
MFIEILILDLMIYLTVWGLQNIILTTLENIFFGVQTPITAPPKLLKLAGNAV